MGLTKCSSITDLMKVQFLLLSIAVISAQDGPVVETTLSRIRGVINRTEAGEVTFINNIIFPSDIYFHWMYHHYVRKERTLVSLSKQYYAYLDSVGHQQLKQDHNQYCPSVTI